MENSSIMNNTASSSSLGEGGGVYKEGGSATLTNSTITDNAADYTSCFVIQNVTLRTTL